MKKSSLFLIFVPTIVAAVVIAFSLGVFFVWSDESSEVFLQHPDFSYVNEESSDVVRPIYSHGLHPIEFFDKAYERVKEPERLTTRSAIVAHHLLVADKIAGVIEQLAVNDRTTIFVVSPNHFSRGIAPAQVSFGTWVTPYGNVDTDISAAELLIENTGILMHEESAAEGEHGIGAITPFIARSFPRARIVPIILHESLSQEGAEEIGETIAMLFPDAAVIASVDMSHNLPSSASGYHDAVTQNYILSGGGDELNLEIDSNASINTLLAYNRTSGTQKFTITHHGNSIEMSMTNNWQENTSHILGYFTYGDPTVKRNASLHFVGDIMLDRDVRDLINENSVDYPWEKMERFLSGSDLRVGNLEGTVSERESTYTYDPPFRFVFAPDAVEAMGERIDVVSLANNHSSDVGSAGLRETERWLDELGIGWFSGFDTPIPRFDASINGTDISLIGYHAFRPNEDVLRETIQAASDEGHFVIVQPHWGEEYVNAPSASQRRLAQFMIDAGADLIVGGHAHVPQGIEMIDDVLVVYSLGNFIFDQPFPETWGALTLGVIIEDDRVILHLLPVNTRDSQPTPIDSRDENVILELVAENSDENLAESIQLGIIQNSYVR
jgi:AmmeMemoRadiSam system protein B